MDKKKDKFVHSYVDKQGDAETLDENFLKQLIAENLHGNVL